MLTFRRASKLPLPPASRLHPCLLAQSCRWLAAQAVETKMVDDMVQYVRSACQGNSQQALDVLKTGVAHQKGAGRDRLQLAIAEVQANNSNWVAVGEHTLPVAQHQATSAKSSVEAELQMEASLVSIRALLIQGKDDLAIKLGRQASKRADSWFPAEDHAESKHQAQLEAATSLTAALHATGDAAGAALQCETGLTLADKYTSEEDMPQASIAAALKQAAALRFAQGKLSEAEGLYARASLAADQRQAEGSSTGVRALDWQQHVAADVLLGAAQAAAAQQAWDKSEQLLNKALTLAEQLHGGNAETPQVGAVLGLMAHVYARSKRITLAEGLHRQAVKLMGLDPAVPKPSPYMPVHRSLAAAAAWRYAQLLSALPKRSTEASQWEQFATAQLPKESDAEAALGPLDLLKGEQDNSSGVVVDMLILRSLPCWPEQ